MKVEFIYSMGNLLTVCKYKKGPSVRVGSYFCTAMCEHSVSINNQARYVICNRNKWESITI